MTWRRTSRSPRPRAPRSRIPGPGLGRSRPGRHGPAGPASDDRSATTGSATACPRDRPRRPRPRRPGPPTAPAARRRCGLRCLYRATDRAEPRDRAHRDPARLRGDAARPEHDVAGPGCDPARSCRLGHQPADDRRQPSPRAAASRPAHRAPRAASPATRCSARRDRAGGARARRSADEDPLTSAAFSLRSSGPVDGRSSLRAQDATRDQYDAAGGSGPESAGSYGGASPYPYATSSYGDPSSVNQTMNTPPYGENYGHGSGAPAPQRSTTGAAERHPEPRPAWRHRRAGPRAARQAYPQDGYQGTAAATRPAATRAASSYPGTGATGPADTQRRRILGRRIPDGGHQGGGQPDGVLAAGRANGYPGNGHRAPYDPQGQTTGG